MMRIDRINSKLANISIFKYYLNIWKICIFYQRLVFIYNWNYFSLLLRFIFTWQCNYNNKMWNEIGCCRSYFLSVLFSFLYWTGIFFIRIFTGLINIMCLCMWLFHVIILIGWLTFIFEGKYLTWYFVTFLLQPWTHRNPYSKWGVTVF